MGNCFSREEEENISSQQPKSSFDKKNDDNLHRYMFDTNGNYMGGMSPWR